MANLHLVTGYAGVEHVSSDDQGSFNAAMMGSGEFILDRGNKFAASIISNNKVRVSDGDMMMQGRHIRLKENTYVDLNFDNGTQGYKRNDLIVVRYSKDSTTDIEQAELMVIKGTPVESNPVDPEHIIGNIITDHALQNDTVLYRVPFDGLNIQPLEKLFKVIAPMENQADEMREKTEKAIKEMQETVIDNYDDALAVTKDNVPVGCKAFQEVAAQAKNGGKNLVGDEFDETKTYAVGDYCIYENVLYIFVSEKTTGAWDATLVEATTVASELSEQNKNKADKSTVETLNKKLYKANFESLATSTKSGSGDKNFSFSFKNALASDDVIYLSVEQKNADNTQRFNEIKEIPVSFIPVASGTNHRYRTYMSLSAYVIVAFAFADNNKTSITLQLLPQNSQSSTFTDTVSIYKKV